MILDRPLTVTGAYLNCDGSMIFHQMVVDRIENNEYIVQNTLIRHSGSQIRIPLNQPYYAESDVIEDCLNCYNDFVYYGKNNEFLTLANEKFNNMKEERWHLLPQAYSITLTPPQEKSEDKPPSSQNGEKGNKCLKFCVLFFLKMLYFLLIIYLLITF